MRACTNVPIVGGLQTLSLNRGTSLGLKAQRTDANGDPITTQATEVYFTVKHMWRDTNFIIQKSLADMTFDEQGFYHFTSTPEDTEGVPYGKYVWDFTAVEGADVYRGKPAHGYFIIGNSAGWIVNETEE